MKSFTIKTIISGTAILLISSGTVFSSTSENFRESLTKKEQVRMVKDEAKYLEYGEAEKIAERIISSKTLFSSSDQGHFRANLNENERIKLILEEKRYLNPKDINLSKLTHSDFKKTGYKQGELRANLSEEEQRELLREERISR